MKKSLIALSLGMFVSTAAFADMSGAYVALDGGQSKASDACTGLPAGWSCSDTATAWRVAGGYNFTPMWGVELSYGDFGKAALSGPLLGVPVSGNWKGTAWQLSGTGTFAINESFSILARIGVVNSTAKLDVSVPGYGSGGASASKTTAGFGIGAQYDFSKMFGIRAQYEDLGKWGDSSTGESKVTLISAGLVFHF